MEFLPSEPELTAIRCYTCNKILADKYNRYQKMLNAGYSIEQALNTLGLNRYCCRLRLRNPFKTVDKIESFEELSIESNPNALTTGALSAINDSSSIVIEPESEIQLKPLPVLPKKEKKETKSYQAW